MLPHEGVPGHLQRTAYPPFFPAEFKVYSNECPTVNNCSFQDDIGWLVAVDWTWNIEIVSAETKESFTASNTMIDLHFEDGTGCTNLPGVSVAISGPCYGERSVLPSNRDSTYCLNSY